MEQVLAASKSSLISSLDFSGPPPVADYVQSRQQIQIFPQGGNSYSPSGVKQLRFSITTNGPFVDMSTLAIQAKLTHSVRDSFNKSYDFRRSCTVYSTTLSYQTDQTPPYSTVHPSTTAVA